MHAHWGGSPARLSPASCWSLNSPQQLVALSAAAAATAASASGHNTPGSCSGVSVGSCGGGSGSGSGSAVVRKYKRAKGLLQVCASIMHLAAAHP
jgi:hypothetical protein